MANDPQSTTTLVDLQQRIEALEIGSHFDATKEAVQKAQMDMLLTLREMRSAMLVVNDGTSSTNNTTIGASSTKELTALQKENAELKKRCAKQEYRIQHLVESAEALLMVKSSTTDGSSGSEVTA